MNSIFFNKIYGALNETTSAHFKGLLRGKKITIVGPSRYLINKKRGKEIDSYELNDIVVKINNGYKLLAIDYGMRCEILYINNKLQKENPDLKEYIRDIKKNVPIIQCVVFTRILGWKIIDRIDDVLIFYVSRDEYHKASSPLKISYLMGTCAIINILLCKPLQLNIIGFDFYERIKISNGERLFYKDLYPEEYYDKRKLNTRLNLTHKDLNKSDLFFIKYMIENKRDIRLIRDIDIIMDVEVLSILDKYSL